MTQPDFGTVLRELIGLDIDSIGGATLERAVASRLACLGLARSQDYWEYLQGSIDELQELIESVVVPETWFFREREAFSVMVRLISEQLLASPIGPPLRILSAPCCTGEEPYSIVLALVEAGLSTTRIHVDAVDVSRRAIVRAKRGIYGANSFRGEDLSFRDRCLQRSGDYFAVPHWLRRLVTFYHENIFSPSFRLNAPPYDIIFCRNVLIYFDRAKQEEVMVKLGGLLKSNGYLFVAPAEAVLASRSGFRSINETMSFAFSKEQQHSLPKIQPNRLRLNDPKELLSAFHTNPGTAVAQNSAPPKIELNTNTDNVVKMGQIRNLANTGQFDQAAAMCLKYLKQKGQSAEVFYLLALINDAKGEVQHAIGWYRKTLYLEPGHSDALLHLALLHERQGDPASAKRLRNRARRAESTDNHKGISANTTLGEIND